MITRHPINKSDRAGRQPKRLNHEGKSSRSIIRKGSKPKDNGRERIKLRRNQSSLTDRAKRHCYSDVLIWGLCDVVIKSICPINVWFRYVIGRLRYEGYEGAPFVLWKDEIIILQPRAWVLREYYLFRYGRGKKQIELS